MTAAKQRPTTADKASSTHSHSHVDTGIGRNRAKRRRRKSSASKTSGQSDDSLIQKDSLSLPLSKDQAQHEQFSAKGSCLPETTSQLSTIELESGQKVSLLTKIKMQLFPVDDVIRKGLEKDGHNPYLELTVSNRKKISSVLKHLKSKWDTSSVALGDLMLFPFNIIMGNLAAYRRWTLEDTDTTADVYASIGSPNIFRLRYGWISSLESNTSVSLTSFPCGNPSRFRNDMNVNAVEVEKQPCKTVSEEHIPTYTSKMPNSVEDKSMKEDKPISLDRAIEPADDSNPGDGLTLSSSFWADSFTNISIGGLLSEASLQATANRGDPVRAGSVSSLQQTPFSCDSFDAAIAAYLHDRPQGSHQLPHASQQSILDAEETCHAFSHQKLVSSRKEDLLSSKRIAASSSSQDADSKLFKFPNPVKVNSRSGTQSDIIQDPKADYPLNAQTENNNVTNYLGTTDISPFTGGDSLSLGGLLGNSLDTWYNCIKDGKVVST